MPAQIKRILSPIGIDYITPYLIPAGEFETVEDMAEQLKSLLQVNHAATYFAFAIENDTIVGFILAYVSKEKQAVILQSFVSEHQGSLEDTMFLRLLLWAEQNEIDEIRFDTLRGRAELPRRWGFEPLYEVLSLSVPKGVEARIAHSLKSFQTGESNVAIPDAKISRI